MHNVSLAKGCLSAMTFTAAVLQHHVSDRGKKVTNHYTLIGMFIRSMIDDWQSK